VVKEQSMTYTILIVEDEYLVRQGLTKLVNVAAYDMEIIGQAENGRQAWFSLPLYFGKLSVLGMSGSYDDQIEIVDYEGASFIGYGLFSVADLEQLNKQVEG